MLSFADEQGRAAGKVRLIVKLSNVAINEYDMSHFDNNDALGMDGVSVNGGMLFCWLLLLCRVGLVLFV